MRLRELVRDLSIRRWVGVSDVEITGIAYDSRQVAPGHLFVCITGGGIADRHLFIGAALAAGASAVIVEQENTIPPDPAVPFLLVENARWALAMVSRNFYDAPSRKLRLVGVTGTNGKTTTTYMVRHVLASAGRRAGVIGTLGARIGERPVPLRNTTPEPPDIERLLAEMVQNGVQDCAMEVSSHALALHRVGALEFDVGVFTNLTQDHLDFHRDLEDYRAAKLTLFRTLPVRSGKAFTGVINADDPSAEWFLRATYGRTLTYGLDKNAEVRAEGVQVLPNGITYRCLTPAATAEVRLRVGGFFNVYNSLAAIATCTALGLPLAAIAAALGDFPGVPGRFEAVPSGKDFTVIVDYAHTPDSLENVLKSARALHPARLVAVFGCGGDRDRGKRPKMGALAARLADRVVVTSDNPRSEDPEAIIADIIQGIPVEARQNVIVCPDRRMAIETAIREARPGDLIVIAGKGHEDYQIFKDRTIHFSDREVAEEVLRSL